MLLKGLLISLFLLAPSLGLSPIIIKGNKFYQKDTNKIFPIKGIGYQPRNGINTTSDDPLTHPDRCKRDIEHFKDLGVNLIRVYQVDPTKDHDSCMKLLEEAGIYLALDLPVPGFSIKRDDPAYTIDMFEHYKSNVDAFDKYSNVAFYFAGNEINDNSDNTDANPFVKAALRDIKAYIKTKTHQVPVGYANNDDPKTRKNIADYFNCGTDEERAEFYAVNVYSWCNSGTFERSGYKKLMEELKDYPLPVFFSEFGCNEKRPREFVKELEVMFGPNMNTILAGGIMYEYSDEKNKYGIVSIDAKSQKVTKMQPEFDNFKEALSKIEVKEITTTLEFKGSASVCPETSSSWKSNKKLPSTPSSEGCKCMYEKLGCVASSTIDYGKGEEVAAIFSYLCSNGAECEKFIGRDAEKANYAPFSGCTAEQQLSWALDAVYQKNDKNADSCSDNGTLQKAKSGSLDECASIKANPADKSDSKSGGSSGASSISSLVSYPSLVLATLTLLFC